MIVQSVEKLSTTIVENQEAVGNLWRGYLIKHEIWRWCA